MTGRGPARSGGQARRRPTVRRASAGLSPLRAVAALAMLLAASGGYGVTASSAFELHQIAVDGSAYTAEGAVVEALGLDDGPNLFGIRTDALAARVRTLPAVLSASVDAALPDRLTIRVVEREPILVWILGERRLLVDRDGVAFVDAAAVGAPPAAIDAATRLPTVIDRRTSGPSVGLDIGGAVDPIDLDAATRLASLRPVDLGSTAGGLVLAIDDHDGFTLRAKPDGWLAVFGFYTRSLRTPELIAGQVRLLGSLLAGREATIQRVILADDHNGTYTTR